MFNIAKGKELEMISFKGRHFEKAIILMVVRWYLAYPLSYRDIEEMMKERGISIDHATINRWVIKYAPLLEDTFRTKHKRPTGMSWHMDETYIKNRGEWGFLYRAVDKAGDTVDFMFSAKRDREGALSFFKKAIGFNGLPHTVTIDKSGANLAALKQVNNLFLFNRLCYLFIAVRRIKYLNNIVEQDHRHIKRIIRPMLGFKSLASAKATITGVELHHMLRKCQMADAADMPVWKQFYALAS
jgi:putative transposase